MRDYSRIQRYIKKSIIIHYSCSSFEDEYQEISAIGIYNAKNMSTITFSRYNNTKEDEIRLLEEFFTYVSKRIEKKFCIVGWSWSVQYGLDNILKRYIYLTKKTSPLDISETAFFDLSQILRSQYKYSGNLKTLAKFNNLSLDNFIDGVKEISLFKDQNFLAIAHSISRKIIIMGVIFSGCLNQTIKIPTSNELFYLTEKLSPYDVFKENMTKIESLIDIKNVNIENSDMQNFLRNLLYSNVITCLETFLSDNFIRKVIDDELFLRKYISESSKFEEKYRISELYKELFNEKNSSGMTLNRFVINKCILDMKTVTFHNLSTASELYKNVLGITFPKDLKELSVAIYRRHNLIHRNGKDIEDNFILITYNDLTDLIKLVRDFISYIHKESLNLRAIP
ncbi:MAG TPA: ribonuclease H-like domain-containing protein [Alphaproteobacteria bacterium]|nr:ribonuclease H-like domain-containing protein [Alphaproteobacteria bacterium]